MNNPLCPRCEDDQEMIATAGAEEDIEVTFWKCPKCGYELDDRLYQEQKHMDELYDNAIETEAEWETDSEGVIQ